MEMKHGKMKNKNHKLIWNKFYNVYNVHKATKYNVHKTTKKTICIWNEGVEQ